MYVRSSSISTRELVGVMPLPAYDGLLPAAAVKMASLPAAERMVTAPIWPTSVKTIGLFATFCVWLLFIWLLPFWSNLFNNRMQMFNHRWDSATSGPNNFLCMTPPEEMHCSDGRNFSELAIVKWRQRVSGRRNVGCGCGQGAIGEGSCPQDGDHRFTLSSYISTPPATGAFTGLLGPTVVSMWWAMAAVHELADPPPLLVTVHYWALFVFQMTFGIFAIGQDCTFVVLHFGMTAAFNLSCWVYNLIFVLIACRLGPQKSNVHLLVIVCASVAIGSSTLASVWEKLSLRGPKFAENHSFFVTECLLVTSAFATGPLILLFGRVRLSIPRALEFVGSHNGPVASAVATALAVAGVTAPGARVPMMQYGRFP